jgi:hypothetical protein
MKLTYQLSDIIRGGTIYVAGDTIAALIAQEFDWRRMLGIALVGATIYAFEIPNYFRWIDQQVAARASFRAAVGRALLAMLYFNPLWIARHILFLKVFTGAFGEIGWGLLRTGLISFAFLVPLSLLANYVIQNVIRFRYRFLASATFSGLVAIYYSLSDFWFG